MRSSERRSRSKGVNIRGSKGISSPFAEFLVDCAAGNLPHVSFIDLSFAHITTRKNEARISLTLARPLAILRTVRAAFRTIAVLRSALSTRRDLLLEMLALHHQLGVLGRSDRRFRPSDRLLWMCLRRLWPRWR
jgi:hypothetical protein